MKRIIVVVGGVALECVCCLNERYWVDLVVQDDEMRLKMCCGFV